MTVAVEHHAEMVRTVLGPFKAERNYFNFAERAVELTELFAPATCQRLGSVKARYDPTTSSDRRIRSRAMTVADAARAHASGLTMERPFCEPSGHRLSRARARDELVTPAVCCAG